MTRLVTTFGLTALVLAATFAVRPRAARAAGTEDDFGSTPFTEYGEFNETSEEEEDMKFMQYGRLFGFGIGTGFEGALGNRGQLWTGGYPALDVKIHYWFDFNSALDIQLFYATHTYKMPSTDTYANETVNVNLVRLGLDYKYYFDTKNLSAPISFANPYVIAGLGVFSKGEQHTARGTTDSDTAMGLSAGAGFEFTIKPRKTYFALEAKAHFVPFSDSSYSTFQSVGISDLTGPLYTFTGSFVLTW